MWNKFKSNNWGYKILQVRIIFSSLTIINLKSSISLGELSITTTCCRHACNNAWDRMEMIASLNYAVKFSLTCVLQHVEFWWIYVCENKIEYFSPWCFFLVEDGEACILIVSENLRGFNAPYCPINNQLWATFGFIIFTIYCKLILNE